jgi:type IX secretion system PorP/SprF family membrane protein
MSKFYTPVFNALSVWIFQFTKKQCNRIAGQDLFGATGMHIIKRIVIPVAVLLLMNICSYGQDPTFSQFFSSPLNVNPALTANINADWRVISNIRNQWVGLASPYTTGTVSYDTKITKNDYEDISENNYVGVGGMLMYDRVMNGTVKSTYASLDLSYNITLAEDDNFNKHRLGVGFGATYVRKSVDFSKLDFEDQFTGSGFNTDLPTGECFLSNTKPFVSASAGMVYSYSTKKSNLDMGIATFHVNKPKQTYLKDPNQYLAMRSVAHINFETFINDRVVLNSNGIYQTQAKASYLSIGGALGYYLSEDEETMITGGLWYSSKNAIIPYAGIAYKHFQFGLTYDATISKLATSSTPNLSTFELSIIIRGKKKPSGNIHCPWK